MKRHFEQLNEQFVNEATAILACTALQAYFALKGYLTSSYISTKVHSVSVTVHRAEGEHLELAAGYLATAREDTEHTSLEGKLICCTNFYFTYSY